MGGARLARCASNEEDRAPAFRNIILIMLEISGNNAAMKSKVFLLLAFAGSPVLAADLGSTLRESPKYEFHGRRPLFEAERCILLSDMPDRAMVYRTPDKPNETMLYYPNITIGKSIITLETKGQTLIARMWNPVGKGMIHNVEDCVQ